MAVVKPVAVNDGPANPQEILFPFSRFALNQIAVVDNRTVYVHRIEKQCGIFFNSYGYSRFNGYFSGSEKHFFPCGNGQVRIQSILEIPCFGCPNLLI